MPDKFKGKTYNTTKLAADIIKESEDDAFVYIIPQRLSGESFRKWLRDYDLEKYVVFQSEGITNPNHPDRPNNLVLYVLASKDHVWREMYDSEESSTELINGN